jgi:hypothetical protein
MFLSPSPKRQVPSPAGFVPVVRRQFRTVKPVNQRVLREAGG